MTRFLLHALVAATLITACKEARVVIHEATIRFTFPPDGAVVTVSDDLNANEPGIQVKVTAEVSGLKDGDPLVLTNSLDLVGGVPRRTEGSVRDGEIAFPGYSLPAGEVTLRIALPDVTPAALCDEHTGCAEVDITVRDTFCRYVDPLSGDILLAADEPVAYQSADPFDPFEIDVVADCTGIADSDQVSLQVNAGLARAVAVARIDATWLRATFSRVPLGEGANLLEVTPLPAAGVGFPEPATVTVERGRCLATWVPGDGGRLLAAQDGDLDPANGMQATLELLTDCTAATTVRVYVKAPGDTSYQEIAGCGAEPDQLACEASPKGCEWMGTSCRPQAYANPTRFRLIDVPLPESLAPFDVQVMGVVDEVARQGVTVPTSYWVDSVPPVIGSESPAGGACVGILQDSHPDNPTCAALGDESSCSGDSACRWYAAAGGRCIAAGEQIQIDAFGSVTGSTNGEEVWLRAESADTASTLCAVDLSCTAPQVCRDGFCRRVGAVDGQSFVVDEVPMPVTGGGSPTCAPLAATPCTTTPFCVWDEETARCQAVTTLEYVAADAAGNLGRVVANLEVFDAAPSVSLTAPADLAVLGVAADLDSVVPDLQYEVRVAVGNVPAGTLGSLLISGQAPIPFVPPSPAGEAWVPVSLADGAYTLRVRVLDPCGNDVEGAPVNITVLAAPQSVGVVGYLADNGAPCAGLAQGACESTGGCMWTSALCVADFTRRTSVVDGEVVSALDLDIDVVTGTGVPGNDRTVDLVVYDTADTSGSTRQCTGTAGAQRSGMVAAASGGVWFADVVLSEGLNCVAVSVDDGINVLTATYVVSRRTAVPSPTITVPDPLTAASLTAATDDSNGAAPGFNYSVEITLSAANDVDGVMELLAGGYVLARAPVSAGTSVVTFADASLPTGDYDLTAIYRDAYGNSAPGAPLAVSVSASGPAILLVAPATGASLTNADFVAEVAPLASNPLSCALVVDGSAGATIAWTSPMMLDTAAPLAPGSHAVRAECADAVATGVTQSITVDIDETPPAAPVFRNEDAQVSGRLVFDTSPAWVNGLVADVASHAGLQHPIAVLVTTGGQDPTGWRVQLTVTPPGIAAQTYEVTLDGGGDPTLVEFAAVDFGAAEGDITFSAVVIDRAGNVSGATNATVTIDRTPPALTQVDPLLSQTTLTRTDDENVDPNYVDIAFKYTVSGAQVGSDLSLTITPTPADRVAADFPMLVAVGAGTRTFPMVALADTSYVARVEAQDDAGNLGSLVYNFDVRGLTARITWAIPSTPGTLNRSRDVNTTEAGFQGRFGFNVTAFPPGTPLTLCSSVQPPGATLTCRWGSDGSNDGSAPDAGWVAATGFISGSPAAGSAILDSVSLAEGVQVLHAEAHEPDFDPDTASSFFTFTIDSVPPVVNSIALTQNAPGNDQASPALIRLNAGEGTVSAGRLNTAVTVAVSGSAPGRLVELLSNRPVANTVVGSASLDASQQASFTAALTSGPHRLTARATDVAGNQNDPALNPEPAIDVVVDFTPGLVSLPAGEYVPYTSSYGPVNDGGTPGDLSDDTLPVSVTVSVSDDQSLLGASLLLERFAAPTGGSATASDLRALAAGQSATTFAAFPLLAGDNYLQATFTDAGGNAVPSARLSYSADFYGPTLTLEVRNAANVLQSCASEAVPCAIDIENPALNNNRAKLDPTDADAGVYRSGGTDLRFTLLGCALEGCASNPVTVRLETRIAASGAPFVDVSESTYGEIGDVISATSYFTRCPNFALDPAGDREVRLSAVDRYGNVSLSSSVFLRVDVNGVIIEVVRLDAGGAPTSDVLDDGVYWGSAQNLAAPPLFATNLRVRVTPVGVIPPTPLSARLLVNAAEVPGSPASLLPANEADFGMVALDTSPDPANLNPNTIDVTVDCGGPCGQRTYSGVVADITAPTYQFDRCQLCALGVPLENNALCSSCSIVDSDANANIDAPPAFAVWNAAGDQDNSPGNGFTILGSVDPLIVKIAGVEDGELVRLESDQGGLIGNSVLSTGCAPVTNCRATFSGLGVPTLAGTLDHRLTVSFSDRAGNGAVPDAVRGSSEAILARTDVLAPAAVRPTVCIGESTTPAGVSPPDSDPLTFEDPACASECQLTAACSRRNGMATLVWPAPADDGAIGSAVTSYEVWVAALGIPYPGPGGTTYTSCDEIAAGDPVEQVVAGPTPAGPGTLERAVVGDLVPLYPHRSYCFVLMPYDDLGNAPAASDAVTERAMPLVNHPDPVAFNALSPTDDQAGAVLHTSAATDFGSVAANVGDLDGDGRDDFAVADRAATRSVHLFLSSGNLTSPDVSIAAPSISAGLFGIGIGGGDFDADGLSDLAICARTLTTQGGPNSGSNAGALYLYYGVGTGGIRRDVNSTNSQLPSVTPDVALMGPASALMCNLVVLAEVNGVAGDDLLMATFSSSNQPRVYGFFGGSRSRFPASFPTPAVIHLDLTNPPTPGVTNRPEFALQRKSTGGSAFPFALVAADVDGNGTRDIAVSDQLANHDASATCNGCGEVYVFRGSSTLSGLMAPPDTSPPALMHILRYVPGASNVGLTLGRIRQPRGVGDPADWLLVHAGGGSLNNRVLVFKGTALGATPGIMPASYPAGGRPAGEYALLDRLHWDGSAPALFGYAMADIGRFDGHGGPDLLVGPGHTTTAGRYGVFLYSFDPVSDAMLKRAIFFGSASFGTAVVGAYDFLGLAGVETDIIVSSRSGRSLFLFR